MKWNNIIYINGSKITIRTKHNIYCSSLEPNILDNGKILNENLFIKKLLKLYKDNNLSTLFIFINLIVVISDDDINNIKVVKKIFNELNYKNIKYIKEIELLNFDDNEIYIIRNGKTIKLYYLNKFNEHKNISINITDYSFFEIKYLILNRIKNKNIYAINNNDYIESILNSLKAKYFIYNDKNFLINCIT